MTERYTVMTFVGPGSDEAKARVAEHPEEITVVYLADGGERSAVWSNRPDIVFAAGHGAP